MKIFHVKSESNDLKKIFSLNKKLSGKSEELTGNLIAYKERNEIVIRKTLSSNKTENIKIKIGDELKINDKMLSIIKVKLKDVKLGRTKNEEFISEDNIKDSFTVRVWKEGDKFYPIGMNGTKKISDYLNDIKISAFERKDKLVLVNNSKIVWVIGQRLDDRFKLTSNTKKVLKLCLK